MKVRLISQSVGINGESIKDLIIYCARVSNPESQEEGKGINKLWRYLKKHGHWSPFEMANVCMEIECTRDISRQLIRHRSFSFQEFSQRYSDPILEGLSFPLREARLQDYENRQNSKWTNNKSIIDAWVQIQSKVKDVALKAYQDALKLDIAKEVARVLLPEGMTTSRIYMNGTYSRM